MIGRRFGNTKPFALVKKGSECTAGVVVGTQNKHWLLDSTDSNVLLSGENGFCRSLVMLTIEYLSKTGANILLFQDCKAYTKLNTELRRYGYGTLYIDGECHITEADILPLLSMATPIAIFINSEHVDCAMKQMLSIIINKYDDCVAPVPVFIFLPFSTAINVKHIIARAHRRNIRFIAHGNQLKLEMEECEAFDVMVAEADMRSAKNAIVYKRGFPVLECKYGGI